MVGRRLAARPQPTSSWLQAAGSDGLHADKAKKAEAKPAKKPALVEKAPMAEPRQPPGKFDIDDLEHPAKPPATQEATDA